MRACFCPQRIHIVKWKRCCHLCPSWRATHLLNSLCYVTNRTRGEVPRRSVRHRPGAIPPVLPWHSHWTSHCWERGLIVQPTRDEAWWAPNLSFDHKSICPERTLMILEPTRHLTGRAHRLLDSSLVWKTNGHFGVRALNLHLNVVLVKWPWYGVLCFIEDYMVMKTSTTCWQLARKATKIRTW